MAEIASKHRLKMTVPATCIIGRSGQDVKDRFIYTDPKTNTLVVKRHPIDIFHVRQFIDERMGGKSSRADLDQLGMSDNNDMRRPPKGEGVMPPKYILKFLDSSGRSQTRAFYDKQCLISDVVELRGTCDIIIQEFVIQKTLHPCVYRFYRNERNVYRAECILNKSNISSKDSPIQPSDFTEVFNQNRSEFSHLGRKNSH